MCINKYAGVGHEVEGKILNIFFGVVLASAISRVSIKRFADSADFYIALKGPKFTWDQMRLSAKTFKLVFCVAVTTAIVAVTVIYTLHPFSRYLGKSGIILHDS